MRHRIVTLCLVSMLASPDLAAAAEDALPTLGDPASQIVSPEKEYRMGRAWLRAFRAQVPVESDPLMQDYLENLTFRLAGASQLKDRRLEVVLVRHKSINAFAVPGGVMGVHTGLFIAAQTRDEFSAVVAHELAHLSQRHFARRVADMRRTTAPTLAGLLTGMVIAATVNPDAGVALMSASQAAQMQVAMKFSREAEQEADRIGMHTLVRASMDPHAFPSMFERMAAASRYSGERPPEFLLSHPVTESRISDTRNRAAQYPAIGVYEDDPEYHIMRTRAELKFEDPTVAIKRYRGALAEGTTASTAASRYGLALALAGAGRHQEAEETLQPLLDKEPGHISYVIAQAEILLSANRFAEAELVLRKQLQINPNNYAVLTTFAKAATANNHPEAAEDALRRLVRTRRNDPHLFYLLAEVHGKAQNIVGVHMARAEYFYLSGRLDEAVEQLRYASRLTRSNYNFNERIKMRIAEMQRSEDDLEF